MAKELSKASTTRDALPQPRPAVLTGMKAKEYKQRLKHALEELDAEAELIVADIQLADKLLPRNAYIGAPGTYARHVYNVLAGR